MGVPLVTDLAKASETGGLGVMPMAYAGNGNIISTTAFAASNADNSNLQEIYSHELHHLWQERAMLKNFYMNYVFNGLTSLLHGGNFISKYNAFEDIPNNGVFW